MNLHCPFCDKVNDVRLVEHYQSYEIYECFSCKGQFCDPLDVDATHYKAWYRQDSENAFCYASFFPENPKKLIENYKKTPYIRTALALIQNLKSCKKLLDIGCSQGAFCKIAQDLGFDVYGIDPAEEAPKYALQKLALKNIASGSFQDIPKDWQNFDVITFFEVIEHLNNPREIVKKSYNLLRPGGYLLISTPSNHRLEVVLGRRQRGDFPPHHLTRWRRKTLKSLLIDFGFTNIIIKNTPINRVDIGIIFVPKLLMESGQIKGFPGIFKEKFISKARRWFLLSHFWNLAQSIGDILAFILNAIFPKRGATLILLAQKPLIGKD